MPSRICSLQLVPGATIILSPASRTAGKSLRSPIFIETRSGPSRIRRALPSRSILSRPPRRRRRARARARSGPCLRAPSGGSGRAGGPGRLPVSGRSASRSRIASSKRRVASASFSTRSSSREELLVVVAHGQDAARLEADERYAALDERHQEVQVPPRVIARLVDEPLGEHGPPAADDLGQVRPALLRRRRAARRPPRSPGRWYSFQVSLKRATSTGSGALR